MAQILAQRAKSPTAQLAGFLAKFTPEVAAAAKDALARMRKRWPGAIDAAPTTARG